MGVNISYKQNLCCGGFLVFRSRWVRSTNNVIQKIE